MGVRCLCVVIAWIGIVTLIPASAVTGEVEPEGDGSSMTPDGQVVDESGVETNTTAEGAGSEEVVSRKSTIVGQTAGGLLVGYGSWGVAWGLLTWSMNSTGGRSQWDSTIRLGTVVEPQRGLRLGSAIAVFFTGPLVVTPTVVNAIGNRQFPTQYRGAFLGTLAGAGVTAVLVAISNDELSGAAVGTLPIFTTVGSVVGYHRQANRRQAARVNEWKAGLAPMPIVDTGNDETTMGLGVRGRF